MWTTVGFAKQKSYFERLLKEERLAQAYLFYGPEMAGKKKFALDFYRLANGRTDLAPEKDPDLRFVAPLAENSDVADFITYIPPKKEKSGREIYIEDIRSIREFVSSKPFYGPRRVVIINDADRLNEESSNALLKILEEPPASALFILITAWPKQLFPTILSRCQRVGFQPHNPEDIAKVLAAGKLAPEDTELLTTLAAGRLGWALKHAEPEKLKETRHAVSDFQKALQSGIFERMEYAKKVAEEKKSAEYIDIWLRWARQKGKDPRKTARVLRKLLELSHLAASPEFNMRLALENFFINL